MRLYTLFFSCLLLVFILSYIPVISIVFSSFYILVKKKYTLLFTIPFIYIISKPTMDGIMHVHLLLNYLLLFLMHRTGATQRPLGTELASRNFRRD